MTWVRIADVLELVQPPAQARGFTIRGRRREPNLQRMLYNLKRRLKAKERYDMTIRFSPNDKGTPPGKLADAELHFSGGPLDGLKLIGFAVWERRSGGRNVTFPARQYSMNGERRSYAILRPIVDSEAQSQLRELILSAYAEHERELGAA